MGIPGLKDELGPGERVSLANFSIRHLQRTNRPLRLAVDISIWLFQVQAAQGGTNPSLRTLFHRLTRFISLPIQPIFVFDGPGRPDYKRGRLISKNAARGQIELSRRLIELFSYPCHFAPGEAEAECAKLQRTGVVDAVMSNDVDALMFGSKVTLLNFSKGSAKQSGAATHVDLYDTEVTDGDSKVSLDVGGMILIALLSGGDYSPAGVSFCGPKLAAEIARAGFGDDLLKITRDILANPPIRGAEDELKEWRERLQYELETNVSGYFKTKHKAVKIPDNFPDMAVLQSCVAPLTSPPQDLERFRNPDLWSQKLKIEDLRIFVGDYLGWKNLSGAKNFVRKLAPSLLKYELFCHSLAPPRDSIPVKISASKTADSFDALPVLKLEYVPLHVVGLNLELETVPANPQDDEVINLDSSENEDVQKENQFIGKKRSWTEYNPSAPQTTWVFDALVRRGFPEIVDKWTRELREKELGKKRPAKKPAGRQTKLKVLDPSMKVGSIRQYGIITKASKQGNITPSAESKASSLATGSQKLKNEPIFTDRDGITRNAVANSTKQPTSQSLGSRYQESVPSDDVMITGSKEDSITRSMTEVERAFSRICLLEHPRKKEKPLKSTRSASKKPSLRNRAQPTSSPRSETLDIPARDSARTSSPPISVSGQEDFPSLSQLYDELNTIERQDLVKQQPQHKNIYQKTMPIISSAVLIVDPGGSQPKYRQILDLHVVIKDGLWSAQANTGARRSTSSPSNRNTIFGQRSCKSLHFGQVTLLDLT